MNPPFHILCVTNRGLCPGDFLERLEAIAAAGPDQLNGVILREKDLSESAYRALATEAVKICGRHGVPYVLHTYPRVARELGAGVHLPLPVLRSLSPGARAELKTIGASCHSVQDAVEAQALGATYITAGHVFATGSKPGLPPRGLGFLREVCGAVTLPVYAIGGVNAGNIADVQAAGALGACVMGDFMRCPDSGALIAALREATG